MSTSIKDQIKQAFTYAKDYICRRIDVVDNLSSTSSDLPLSAKQGKVLQDQISNLNTDLKNNEIAVTRTSAAWLAASYTSYDICSYTIQSAGVYLATAKLIVSNYKTDRAYYFSLNQNSQGNGSEVVLQGNGAYNIIAPLSYIFTCKAGDKIYTVAQVNYVASGESYAGLATGYLKLIKLHS